MCVCVRARAPNAFVRFSALHTRCRTIQTHRRHVLWTTAVRSPLVVFQAPLHARHGRLCPGGESWRGEGRARQIWRSEVGLEQVQPGRRHDQKPGGRHEGSRGRRTPDDGRLVGLSDGGLPSCCTVAIYALPRRLVCKSKFVRGGLSGISKRPDFRFQK
jgi:hypothetical protein